MTIRSRVLAGLLGMTVLSVAYPIAASADTIETVVITGSRIPEPSNATSPSPLSVKTDAQIQMTSAFSLEDVLQKMTGPDTTAGLTNSSNNGGVGLSEIGLRNLGPTRTLVLIDGQRLVPIFSGSSSVPDLNSVPLSLVDHIEVLRDGASSIYGADAIGGVVNVITKKDFDGLAVNAHAGDSQQGGGDAFGITGTVGMNTDRGNVTFAALYEHLSPVDQPDRKWAQNAFIGTSIEGGSAYRSQLNILQDENSHTVWNTNETSYNDPTLGSLPCLTYLPNVSGGRVKLNAGCPDVNPPQMLNGMLTRTQFSMNSHYQVTPGIEMILQGFYTRRNSEQRLRPEPLLGDQIASTNPTTGGFVFGGFNIPVDWPGFTDPLGTASITPYDNPLNPNSTHVGCKDPNGCITALYTPNEFGPRDYKQLSSTYRIRFGFDGDIFNNYHWEVGYVFQRNDTNTSVGNSGNWQHLAEATGQAPCTDVPGGCTYSPLFGYAIPTTPFNFFNGVNTLNPQQVQYLTTTLEDNNDSYENYFYGDVSGALFSLPAGDVQAAVGVERRVEHLSDNPDALQQTGFAAGPTAATSGGYNVSSAYGELRIPVLKNSPIAQSLTITPSARYDSYSSFGQASTWKIGADWQVIDQLRFRATYATGLRAPSVAELFGGNAISYIPVSGDPCDSRTEINDNANMAQTLGAAAARLAPGTACYNALTAQGLTPAQIAAYQSPENNLNNDQRGLLIGGFAGLKPELSRSWNVGTVITPMDGLSFDVDYYEIKIWHSILTGGIAQNSGPDLVANGCFVDQNPGYCALIQRSAGGIFQIGSLNTNLGISQVKGLDLEATFNTEAAGIDLPFPGSLNVDIQAEREFSNTTENPDGSVNQFAGRFLYSNESIQPHWKGQLNLDYTLDRLNLHWDTSFIDHMQDFGSTGRAFGDYIPNYYYHNISAAYHLDGFFGDTDTGKDTQIIVGVNNLFDKDPPILNGDSVCKCNSLAGPYDFVGRFYYTRLAIKM